MAEGGAAFAVASYWLARVSAQSAEAAARKTLHEGGEQWCRWMGDCSSDPPPSADANAALPTPPDGSLSRRRRCWRYWMSRRCWR